jgi:hypothetical protein
MVSKKLEAIEQVLSEGEEVNLARDQRTSEELGEEELSSQIDAALVSEPVKQYLSEAGQTPLVEAEQESLPSL